MSKHISSFNDSPSENIELADEILETVDDMCKGLSYEFFLYDGTALGLYRDGTYVEDNDLDITVVCTEAEYQELWNKLAGLPNWNCGAGLRKDRIQVDLHYTDSTLPCYVVPHWRPKTYTFHEFDTVIYRDRSYNVPAPIEEYLEWEFGELWETPMSRDMWMAIDTQLQRLLLEKDE